MADDVLTTEEAEQFREKVRSFLAANTVPAADFEQQKQFQAKLAEAGLAGIVFDREYGGAGLSKAHDRIVREEMSKFPTMNNEFIISHGMCLPVLNDFGTEQQKKTFMPDNIAGRTLWCQMFSEPGAGSDVASLQTKAERDGDEWI
ncbi:MAG: acyl-CoA dehydrogenase family protein, partial [Acidimicrobiales bacterium]|nr:acyl-CoA dehydrogenase family protein [Acidimicrobiales bacterium]